MLSVQDVRFARGAEALFDGLTFSIYPGQKTAIVGRNGVGKSTLFEILLGRAHPDRGNVDIPAGWRISHMAQEVIPTDRSATEFVLDGHSELRAVEARITQLESLDNESASGTELAAAHAELADLGGYEAPAQAARILTGLGFSNAELTQPFKSFSGGWRIRLGLAQALMRPSELLLLDEPTNHLDLEATLWLEQFLRRFDGTVIIIAHDRSFLDRVADQTLHLHSGRATMYKGGYSAFEKQLAETLALQEAMQAKREAQVKHMSVFIDRFRYKASKARQVQSRIKALERMTDVAVMQADSPYRVQFPNPDRVPNPIVHFRNLTLGYDRHEVLKDLSQSILPGDRIGVLGTNGAGKSTLLKALVGELQPLQGELSYGEHFRAGYFAQHQLELLDMERSPISILQRAYPLRREQQLRDLLGGWGFDATMISRPVHTLSGGEKARLVLALIAETKPNLLVLDEPSNHLDLDMRDALALALQVYTGAVIMVSHDRTLLDRTTDTLWHVAGGSLQSLDADIDAYIAIKTQNESVQPQNAAETSANKAERRRLASLARERIAPLKKTVRKLEADMDATTTQLKATELRLADPDVYHSLPPDELDALLKDAHRLRETLEKTEAKWLQAAEALEAAQTEVTP